MVKGIELGGLKILFKILGHELVEHVGLLFGRGNRALIYIPLKNIYKSPVRFLGDPWDTVIAFKVADEYGLDIIGVFHNHPRGRAVPSGEDLVGMKRWPHIWVIASETEIRAWRLERGELIELGVA